MNKRLYVESLPAGTTESSLRELFSKLGPVTEVKLMLDLSTGRFNGRAFVTMATPELAQAALKSLHSHSLGGRNIAVTEARPVEERTTGLIGQGFEPGIGSDPQVSKRMGRDNGRSSRGPTSRGRSSRGHRSGKPGKRG